MVYTLIRRIFRYIKINWIPILLILSSIYDLRVELRLLLDSFSFTSLLYALSDHPLAIVVLLSTPGLFKSIKL